MFTTQLTQLWASTLPNDHGLENDETTMWSPSAIHCYGVPRTSLPHSGHLPIGPKGMPGTFQAHFDQLPRATQGYPGLPRATHCHMSATDLATRLFRYSNLAGIFSQALGVGQVPSISHVLCQLACGWPPRLASKGCNVEVSWVFFYVGISGWVQGILR